MHSPFYRAEDLAGFDPDCDLGYPGQYPFTRGIQPTMYRGRLWTMRQYSGIGDAEQSNQRFKFLLAHGSNGLSVAFDLPTQIGYDSDSPWALGEVGKAGVAIDSIEDMEPSNYVYGPRRQQRHGREGDGGLHHHGYLCPTGKHRRIGGRECRAGVERQKEIIHKTGRPVLLYRLLRPRRQGHLRKEKISFGVVAAKMARMGSARIQPPVPRRENQNVRGPESSCRAQQIRRCDPVDDERADEHDK
jgi:hypothetical protein